jgi:hypothetical protein
MNLSKSPMCVLSGTELPGNRPRDQERAGACQADGTCPGTDILMSLFYDLYYFPNVENESHVIFVDNISTRFAVMRKQINDSVLS